MEGSEGPGCKNSECQGPNGLDLVQRAVGGANGFPKGSSCQMPGTVLSSGNMGTSLLSTVNVHGPYLNVGGLGTTQQSIPCGVPKGKAYGP